MQGVNELQAAVGVLVLVLGGSELNPNIFPQSAMWLVPSCGRCNISSNLVTSNTTICWF